MLALVTALSVVAPPAQATGYSPVTGLSVNYDSVSNSAMVNWTNPASANFATAEVWINRNDVSMVRYSIDSANSKSIEGFFSGTYTISVIAKYGDGGEGLAATAAPFTVSPDYVCQIPSASASATGNIVTVSWANPLTTPQAYASLTSYEVTSQTADGTESPFNIVNAAKHTTKVENVPAGTYRYVVRGRNAMAYCDPVYTSYISVDGKPSAPLGVTAARSGSSVTVSWSAPESDGGSSISGYRVYQFDDVNPEPSPWDVAADATTLTIPDHSPGRYRYEVIAMNAVGFSDSETSAWVHVGEAPHPPGAIKASITTTKLLISWSASTDTSGYLTEPLTYVVQLRKDSGEWSTVADVFASVLSTTVDIDTSGTYQVRVIASNEFGNSDPSTSDRVIALLSGSSSEASPIHVVAEGLAVVDASSAKGAAARKAHAASRINKAPVVKAPVGTVVTVTASGLAKRHRYLTSAQNGKQWLKLGKTRANRAGAAVFPALACTKTGKYVLRLANASDPAAYLALRCVK